MPNKIEKLQQENQAIKQELDALKTMAQSSEKEKKKSELDARIQKMKQEAQTEYQQESDQNTREKIKAEQEKLETFSSELNALGTEVTTTNAAPVSQEHQSEANENPQPSQEEKGVWGKTKDFVSEQWKDVRDKEKRKEEGGKNALRTACFIATGVGAVALAYKGIKKLFGKDEEENPKKGKSKTEEMEETVKILKGKKKSRWKKALAWTLGAAGVVTGGVLTYRNRNTIKGWGMDILGKNLNIEEAIAKVEGEIQNGIIKNKEAGVFSAHFDGIKYDEATGIMESYGEKIKIDEKNKKIEGLNIQFSKREELVHAANIVNFMRRKLKGRGANDKPFCQTRVGGDFAFNFSDKGKKEVLSANNSSEWTYLLGSVGGVAGGILGWYCGGVMGTLKGAAAGAGAGVLGGAVIDNSSSAGRACSTIASGKNFDVFTGFLNAQKDSKGQSLWIAKAEQYDSDDTSPIHPYLNKVKKEIDDEYGAEDSSRRELSIEVNPQDPSSYTIKSYNQQVKLKIEGSNIINGNRIDFTKIKKVSLGKYTNYDWGSGLNLGFPHNEAGLKEAIRVANLTNKIREDYKDGGAEKMPFSYGTYKYPFNLDIDTPGFMGTAIVSHEKLKKYYPTLLEDLSEQKKLSSQKSLWDQAKQDQKTGCSQYIKYLHQMQKLGEKTYWEKVD